MLKINDIRDIGLFANFTIRHFGEKTIIIYDDHRCILTVLFEASRLGLCAETPNLIFFDRHDDAKSIHPDTMSIIEAFGKSGLRNVSSRKFKNFVEFDISEYDDDWVKVGMELGLLNSVVNIGDEENFNLADLKDHLYLSADGKTHHGHRLLHLREELHRQGGRLGDNFHNESRSVREIFGYNPEKGFPSLDNFHPFILDFDLDCFTTICQNKTYAWPENIFREEYGCDNEASELLSLLISNAKFITICREPDYCGGIGESDKILGYLDRYLFNGCLGCSTIQ